jgi:hypothetical protein
MMRLIKFLLGLTVGAVAGVLFAPKSGRELREQLRGGAAAKLLPPLAEHYPLPEGRHTEHEDATAPAQSPIAAPPAETAAAPVSLVEEAPVVEPEDLVEEAPSVEPENLVEEIPAVAPEMTGEDLLARIAATRAAVEAELAEPFGPASTGESAPAAEPAQTAEPAPPTGPATYWELTPQAVAAAEPAPEEGEVENLWADETDETAAMPVETPSAAISETPAAEAVAEPVAQAVEEPVAEPVAVIFEEPVAEPVAAIFEEPVAVIFEEPVAEPAAAVFEEPVLEPAATDAPTAEIIADTVVIEPTASAPRREAPTLETREEPAREPGPVPSAETPGGAVDQAEMRRRIEETRARLKAKAFDAMMSGESALLRNDSGTRAAPASDGARLAPDVDSTIDESLSPEDV